MVGTKKANTCGPMVLRGESLSAPTVPQAMLFASILRVLDDAYDIDEPREIPHVPGPIARAVFLRHAGRFHKGVCNTKECVGLPQAHVQTCA